MAPYKSRLFRGSFHTPGSHTRPSSDARHLIWKTVIVSIAVIAANVFGNYGLKRGLARVGLLRSWSPAPYIHAFVNSWVSLGVGFMLGWLVLRLVLLSWADLSYVLPVTSLAYSLTALTGVFLLHEKVDPVQWLGIVVITAGVVLVGFTYPRTTGSPRILK